MKLWSFTWMLMNFYSSFSKISLLVHSYICKMVSEQRCDLIAILFYWLIVKSWWIIFAYSWEHSILMFFSCFLDSFCDFSDCFILIIHDQYFLILYLDSSSIDCLIVNYFDLFLTLFRLYWIVTEIVSYLDFTEFS